MILQRRNWRRGAEMVEVALLLPIFLLMLLSIFEYARFFFIRELLNNAAREGCRYAIVNSTITCTCASPTLQGNVKTTVINWMGGQNVVNIGFTTTPTVVTTVVNANGSCATSCCKATPLGCAAAGTPIAVSVTGIYKPIIPTHFYFWGVGNVTVIPANITMSGKCIMTTEGTS